MLLLEPRSVEASRSSKVSQMDTNSFSHNTLHTWSGLWEPILKYMRRHKEAN